MIGSEDTIHFKYVVLVIKKFIKSTTLQKLIFKEFLKYAGHNDNFKQYIA